MIVFVISLPAKGLRYMVLPVFSVYVTLKCILHPTTLFW